MKKIQGIHRSPNAHWVGDGFPVRSLFTYDHLARHISPFLLLDYAGPHDFAPTTARRGVGQHPHRGFETVTIVYQGELEHRDSTGAGGLIGPGDVQWMTAAGGIIHEEFHSPAFAQRGGTLEMVQLWVNLPARDKRAAAGYQTLLANDIPVVTLEGEAGSLRVIAGRYLDQQGPARTFTEMDVWDLRLKAGATLQLPVAAGRNAALVVLRGTLRVNDEREAGAASLVLLERDGDGVRLEALADVSVLLLSGEPIDEPIVGYGPFVMNSQAEIAESFDDFQAGRFGQMGGTERGVRQ
ncbi:redox-sensitive bicupin YhaK (pirin superfamily) [Pseudomonas sp. TE6288]|uniref:pirin family protein n=1 Tax=Pseudomonas TaxID=286 RepID=UPI000C88A555|nr:MULTISPECIES: pirin family protein [Pseudomonas]MDF9756509.1 redox-sensitive bicupin YhaK (pirin superfamily) [Pseudomonas hunanensis]PMZ90277.1 quercetin 2,3-dioxygenase [Pseudomonas sp. FW305-42]PNA25972.1 quercetin 2,3-dioxygenase [Pseudomonas sp. MPR-R1B]PNB27918.1 quercetin 2,3-dioxygenase [Pseudomonas sp. DP16D-E2]PNB44846.1 quercetin 2,3-dioxygenase [Pseudomonas sp. FW305-17]